MKVVNLSNKFPYVELLMSNLRDISIQADVTQFNKSICLLGQILGIELSGHLNYIREKVTTPFEKVYCNRLKQWPTLIPILRAGRALQEGVHVMLINSPVVDCYSSKCINGQRIAEIDTKKLNPTAPCVICDPMIVKGKSIISVIEKIQQYSSSQIYIVSCVTTDYALTILESKLPKNTILFTCAIDRFVPGMKGTRPGIGDVGDLLYGCKVSSLKMKSLYMEMNENAKHIPANANVKFIFRHSFRDPFEKENDYRTMTLNEYGIQKAREFGMSIEYPLGSVFSSSLKRCVQTLQFMTNSDNIVIAPDYLTSVFTYDSKQADQQIRLLGSLKKVIIALKKGDTLPGFYPLKKTVSNLIDFIFSTGNKACSMDLYCTHDFHIGMLLVMLFDDLNDFESLSTNWPRMLEGVLLYGTRDSFYCFWRNKSKFISND